MAMPVLSVSTDESLADKARKEKDLENKEYGA